MKNRIIHFILVCVLYSCSNTSENKVESYKSNRNEEPKIVQNQHLLQAVLWFQNSGEMKALFYQAYSLAKLKFDKYLMTSKSKKKKAVIMDIDETILDNSPYEAHLILTNSKFDSDSIRLWQNEAKADTLPGVYDFLLYVSSKAEVFYISNRDTSQVKSTLTNLQKFNLPNVDREHLLLRSDKSSSKEYRRIKVATSYDIVMLCGDNLGDFNKAFDYRNENQAIDSVKKYNRYFGDRFIIVPNPMYGGWENSITKNGTSYVKLDSLRKLNLKGY